MSVKHLAAVFKDQRITTPKEFAVMVILADLSDETQSGLCPEITPMVAGKARCTVEEMRAVMARLEKMGVLQPVAVRSNVKSKPLLGLRVTSADFFLITNKPK